jgi:hypothetical protein
MYRLALLVVSSLFSNLAYSYGTLPLRSDTTQTDYYSACQAMIKNTAGQVEYVDDNCRCKVGKFSVDPFLVSSEECETASRTKAECDSLGTDLGRFVADAAYFGYSSACFCRTTGRFIDASRPNSKAHTPSIDACRSAQTELEVESSYRISRMLSHYFDGLPGDVVRAVNTTQLDEVRNFLRPENASRTVKIVGTRKGMHGSDVIVFRKKYGFDASEGSWEDFHDPIGQQGDPRTGYMGLGPIIGPFFGFDKIDEITYTIPTIEEFDRAAAQLNRSKINVSGHGFRVAGKFGIDSYLSIFSRDGGLPMSEVLKEGDQTYFFHDNGLHLAGIAAFPPDLWHRLQWIVKSQLAFEHFLETKYSDLFASNGGRRFMDMNREGMALIIDNVSVEPLFSQVTKTINLFGHLLLQPVKEYKTSPFISDDLKQAYDEYSLSHKDPGFDHLMERLRREVSNTTSTQSQLDYFRDQHLAHLEAEILALRAAR